MAGAGVSYTFDDQELRDLIQKTGDRIKNVRPVMTAFGEYMLLATADRFDAEQSPDGKPWKSLSPKTIKWKQDHNKIDKILQQDGYLRMVHYTAEKTGLSLWSNKVYAAIHQRGGMAGRNHAAEIPKREFLGFSDEDKAELMVTVKDWLVLGVA